MVIDWLLAELSESVTSKLEVYTFGNAANHFNSPLRLHGSVDRRPHGAGFEQEHVFEKKQETIDVATAPRVISHIEHYAHTGDFVSRWGVLHFAGLSNRFVGRVFVRDGSGHMFNQHYLANMFPMTVDKRSGRSWVAEGNSFVDGWVDEEGAEGRRRVRDVSRLWTYRNGKTPAE